MVAQEGQEQRVLALAQGERGPVSTGARRVPILVRMDSPTFSRNDSPYELGLAVLALVLLSADAVAGQALPERSLVREQLLLPVTIESASLRLETLVVAPPGDGPFPVALVMHGSPRKAEARRKMTPNALGAVAVDFAQRGYFAVVAMRRGYGHSGGAWSEGYGGCTVGDYERAGRQTAADMNAVIEGFASDPRVDPTRIVAVGQSAGGFGALALASQRPAGLRAAINLAGGRGSLQDGRVCSPERLVAAFRSFGAARVPTLWVYARNDAYFGPKLAQRFLRAFEAGGGRARFLRAGRIEPSGHKLTTRAAIERWRRDADRLLVDAGLPTWDRPPRRQRVARPDPPEGLSRKGVDHWHRYLEAPGYKAFAKSRTRSRFSWRSGRRSAREAREEALAGCGLADCEIVAREGAVPASP